MPNAVLATDPLERLAKPEFDFDKAGPNKPLSDLASADVVQKLQNKGALAKQRLANIGNIGATFAGLGITPDLKTGLPVDPNMASQYFGTQRFADVAQHAAGLGKAGWYLQPPQDATLADLTNVGLTKVTPGPLSGVLSGAAGVKPPEAKTMFRGTQSRKGYQPRPPAERKEGDPPSVEEVITTSEMKEEGSERGTSLARARTEAMLNPAGHMITREELMQGIMAGTIRMSEAPDKPGLWRNSGEKNEDGTDRWDKVYVEEPFSPEDFQPGFAP